MKTLTELKLLASKYVEEIKQKSINLYEPIFRLENNKLVLGYMLLEFDGNYGIKRPTEWILQNIDDGEIIELNNIKTKDFSNQNVLPLNKIFLDSGMSPLYDEINSITSSFDKWRKSILNDLGSNDINPISYINDNQILMVEDEFISPKDFIIVNSEEVFSNMYNQLFEIGKTISESYNNFHNNLFEKIRNCYLSGSINIELIKRYLNFLKYSFPENLELINKFNNIDGTDDVEYDNKIIEMINHKKNLSKNSLIEQIDSKLKEIDPTYNPDNLKDVETKNACGTTIKDLISKIDEQLDNMDNNMKEVMISPEMYEEEINHYSLEELEKELQLQYKYINDSSNMSEKITRFEYINVINKVKQNQEHVNELVMKKIARFIEWDDPKLQSYYRIKELETFKKYKNVDELSSEYDNWKKMALVEIEEEKILNPIKLYDTEEMKNRYYRNIEKQLETQKLINNTKMNTEQVINFIDEKISQIENGELENRSIKEKRERTSNELDNMIDKIDNFIEKLNTEQESVPLPTPEELEQQEKRKEIERTRELRNKVSSAIRVYQEYEWPHIDIEKLADGSLKIDYPERIIELKEFILNSEYYNKDYGIPIEKILSKDIVCLTKEEALAYICYAFKMEEKQKGFIANMINSNAFSMLCARIYNNTYNL